STAEIASSTVPSATSAITASDDGSTTGKRAPADASRHLPPMKSCVGTPFKRRAAFGKSPSVICISPSCKQLFEPAMMRGQRDQAGGFHVQWPGVVRDQAGGAERFLGNPVDAIGRQAEFGQ